MKVKDVVDLYTLFVEHGIQVWIGGGWGIDALLGTETRPHKDLDLFVGMDDLATMADILAARDFTLTEIWSENRWMSFTRPVKLIGREEAGRSEVATAFVLRDPNGLELDFHVFRFDERNNGVPAWDDTTIFAAESFEGRGTIANMPVCCLSARIQMTTHTGYELQDKDLQDMRLLHERFGELYHREHIEALRKRGGEV